MGNDIFFWENGGALVHHCPTCQTPLSHERCQKRCLGKHVDWCSKYHCQLFKKGCSATCMACVNSSSQSEKRNRNIAELLKKLHELSDTDTPSTPLLTPRASISSGAQSPRTDSRVTKKDRKAAKNAAKAASRPKCVTALDIERVSKALHPHEDGAVDAEEGKLLDDPDIKLNVFYHRGVSNTREIRQRFLDKEGRTEFEVPSEEMDRIMAALHVPAVESAHNSAERALIVEIHKAVKEDLVHMHGEEHETMRRKAGFWRWASRKAYDRLVANGRIWDWKNGRNAAAAEDDADEEQGDTLTLPEEAISDDINGVISQTPRASTTSKSSSSSFSGSRKTSISSSSQGSNSSVDGEIEDGWTSIEYKFKLKPAPTARHKPAPLKLQFSANGGLAHLAAKRTPQYDDDGYEDEYPFSPFSKQPKSGSLSARLPAAKESPGMAGLRRKSGIQ